MNLEGIAGRYAVNRPLNEYERKRRLAPKYQGARSEAGDSRHSVIRINSAFLETVDKFYSFRGMLTMFALPLAALALLLPMGVLATMFTKHWQELTGADLMAALATTAFLCTLMLGMFGILLWVLSKDLFAYTHYPVRLNRKNRMVYVFRSNKPGGVLKVKWDEVYWVMAVCSKSRKLGQSPDHEIRGHVMDPDGVTVRDTFCLGDYDADTNVLARHWEHFRRYMEGGPGQIDAQELLPIAQRRESFWFGMKRAGLAFSNAHWIPWVLFSPLWATMGVVRRLAMLTSRVPRWPPDVEAECAAPPGDEPRKKDTVSRVGDMTDWMRLVPVSAAGASIGGYFYYWVFTASGFTRTIAETVQMLR